MGRFSQTSKCFPSFLSSANTCRGSLLEQITKPSYRLLHISHPLFIAEDLSALLIASCISSYHLLQSLVLCDFISIDLCATNYGSYSLLIQLSSENVCASFPSILKKLTIMEGTFWYHIIPTFFGRRLGINEKQR